MLKESLPYSPGLRIHHHEFDPVVIAGVPSSSFWIRIFRSGRTVLDTGSLVADADFKHPIGTGRIRHDFVSPPMLHAREELVVSSLGHRSFNNIRGFDAKILSAIGDKYSFLRLGG